MPAASNYFATMIDSLTDKISIIADTLNSLNSFPMVLITRLDTFALANRGTYFHVMHSIASIRVANQSGSINFPTSCHNTLG